MKKSKRSRSRQALVCLRHTFAGARFCWMHIVGLLLLAQLLPADHFPGIPATGFEAHSHARLFYYSGDLSGMAEYTGRFEEPGLEYRYQSLTLGGYYRVHPNLKAGVFYRTLVGARHDDDWVSTSPGWEWVDTASRVEQVVLVDLTPRLLLDVLPGRDWVGSLKARYSYNLFNGQQKLLLRPGVTWFWVIDREAVFNVSAQYASYFSLNFGSTFWYQHGPYLNLLYHVTPWLQLDASLSRQSIYWSESEDFLRLHPGEQYGNNMYAPWVVDVGFIVTLRD